MLTDRYIKRVACISILFFPIPDLGFSTAQKRCSSKTVNRFITSCIYVLLLFGFQRHHTQYDNTRQTGTVSQGLCRHFCKSLVHSKEHYSHQDPVSLYHKDDPAFPRSHFVRSCCRSLVSQHWTPSLPWHSDPDWLVLEQAGWLLNLSVLLRLHRTWCGAVTQFLPRLEPSCSRSGQYKSLKSRGTHT